MIEKHAIARNFIYNSIFKVFQLATPIITVPYVARVLGSDGIGIYAFTGAVMAYFSIFAALGVGQYGNRSIAYVRDDIEERSRIFFEIFSLKLISSLIALTAYIIFILNFGGDYKILYFIQILAFLGVVLDVNWFYAGLEDFKKIVTRDISIRIISIILIFTLVKTKEDIVIYVFILSASFFVCSLYMCCLLKDKIVFTKINLKGILSHLKPVSVMFIPVVASVIYTLFDRVLLGIYVGESEVGYYEMTYRIITVTGSAAAALGIVMYPRMSSLFAKKDFVTIKEYIGKSFRFLNFISIPMVFGLIAIANSFVPWFLGEGFEKVSLLLCISSLLIFLNGWGGALSSQVLLPMGREKVIAINACIGAGISLSLNLLLIPHFQAAGAAVSSVVTAFILRMNIIYILKDFLPFREMLRDIWKYFFAGAVMFIIVYNMGISMPPTILTTFAQVFAGILIYIFITFILKCEMNRFLLNRALQMSGLSEKTT